jgi:tripartite-type tricarboxylate transporter receptor subunit TctC
MLRRLTVLVLALLALSPSVPVAKAQSDSWPTKPIRWIVPYPPGGGTDLVSRAIGAKLQDYLSQPIVVDNRPGGNTIIGTAALAQSAPDGYTVALIADPHAINVAGNRKMPYDTERDFVPIIQLLNVPFIFIANSELVPARNLPDLVKMSQDKPGWLTFGSLGPGSPHEIAGAWLRAITKMDMLIVPYRGVAPAFKDTVAGHVKTMILGVSVADEMIKAGKVHPIATTAPRRLATMPEVPTVAEQGYPDFQFVTWYGVVAPRGTPEAIVKRLNAEINRALADPETRDRIAAAGGEIVGGPPERLAQVIRTDIVKYRKIFAETGYKLD